jgi:hypothetical protein
MMPPADLWDGDNLVLCLGTTWKVLSDAADDVSRKAAKAQRRLRKGAGTAFFLLLLCAFA